MFAFADKLVAFSETIDLTLGKMEKIVRVGVPEHHWYLIPKSKESPQRPLSRAELRQTRTSENEDAEQTEETLMAYMRQNAAIRSI